MAKRRVAPDSDDEASTSSQNPASKKVKTQASGTRASSGRTRADDVEVEDLDDEETSEAEEANGVNVITEEDQEAEERKFEEEHGDKIRQYLDAKRNHHGVRIGLSSPTRLLLICKYRESRIMAFWNP